MNKQLRILILEDDDTDAELMKHELRKGNITFESRCVETREAFEKSLEDFAPDLILADYTLPAFDGRSALRISNEKLPDVPFIFVSGTIGEDFAIESLKSGATDYVLKDRISRLAPAVNRALREAEEKIEYKKAEKALKDSEEKLRLFRSLIDQSNDAFFVNDPETGRILDANDKACISLGYRLEELLNMRVFDFEATIPDHFSWKEHVKGVKKKKNIILEGRHKRKDGTIFPVEINVNYVVIGNVSYMIAVARDITERKQTEEELRIKARLLDDATDSIFVHDLDGNFIYINEGAYKSRGFSKEEIMGINLHDIVTPEYAKLIEPRIKKLIKDGEGTFESVHLRKDKSTMPIETHARIIESGGRKLVLSVIRDITERKRAEKALQYRLEFEKLITSISTNFINIASDEIDGEINSALKKIGEFAGVDRSYVILVSEDGAKIDNIYEWCAYKKYPMAQRLKGVLFESFPWFAEKMRRHETIYVPRVADLPVEASVEIEALQKASIKSIIKVPIIYGGVLFGYLGFISVQREVTWSEDLIALLKIVGEIFVNALVRKMAEAAVWESESRFRAIFEKAAIGMTLTNLEGRPIVSNPALQEMLGYSGEEIHNMVFTEFTYPDDIAFNMKFFKELAAGERDFYQIEKRYIRKNGGVIWGRLTVSLIRGDNGEPQFSIGMVEDITERKKAEELLKEKARAELYGFIVSALPAFASGVPSQVRNILVKNFAMRFERNIRPRFEEKTRQLNLYFDDGTYNVFDVFMLWIAGLFSNLGIKTRTTPGGVKRSFELLNCPWKGEASGNPIFCFICRTIVMRSFTWTSLKGIVEQKSSIANGSQTCRFEINVNQRRYQGNH